VIGLQPGSNGKEEDVYPIALLGEVTSPSLLIKNSIDTESGSPGPVLSEGDHGDRGGLPAYVPEPGEKILVFRRPLGWTRTADSKPINQTPKSDRLKGTLGRLSDSTRTADSEPINQTLKSDRFKGKFDGGRDGRTIPMGMFDIMIRPPSNG
jgi:hypothetical protein